MKRIFKTVKTRLIRFWKDEKGEGSPISGLLWAAIIVLAVIGMKTILDSAFTTFGGSFSTWLSSKATFIFK